MLFEGFRPENSSCGYFSAILEKSYTELTQFSNFPPMMLLDSPFAPRNPHNYLILLVILNPILLKQGIIYIYFEGRGDDEYYPWFGMIS